MAELNILDYGIITNAEYNIDVKELETLEIQIVIPLNQLDYDIQDVLQEYILEKIREGGSLYECSKNK